MKQKRLVLLTALVAVLFAAYFGLTALTAKTEAAKLINETVRTLKGSVNEITATYGDGWTLRRAGEAWQWDGDADFPLTQTYPAAMSAVGEGVEVASKVLDDLATANAADYGLDAPQNTVTLKTDEGDEVTLRFGDENTHTGETYCTVSGDNALYTVSSSLAQTFAYDLYGMVTLEAWPVTTATQITSVSLTQGDKTLRLDVAQTDETETTYTVTEDGTAHAANAQAAMGLLEDVAALSVGGCLDYKADDASLEQYGLTPPAAILTVTWTDAQEAQQTVTLSVGAGTEAATYFTRMEGSTAVNSMDGMAVASILNTTAVNLQAAPAGA